MKVFNADEVKKCLEDVFVGGDKQYALWLLEWAIDKRSIDLAEHDKQIRAEVIEEITQKVEFEEKWLFECYKENGCKYSSKDIDIAFGGIKHHLRKLKEQK